MTPIDRNPDIDLDKEEIPAGMNLVEGKCLMHTARSNKIPFGVASARNKESKNARRDTIGLIIRDADLKRFKDAVEKKIEKRLLKNK